MPDLSDLVAMGLFAHVVEQRSFTEAARRTGLSKSVVSRRIAALEDRLGTRLLNRTTRRLSLTESGLVFYERCARMLAEAADAEDAVAELSGEPRGLLRIGAPVSLCQMALPAAFAAFLAEHKGVRLEICASDRLDDVVAEGFDLTLRVGNLTDSSLVARKLTDVPIVVVGSPEYLEHRGPLSTPDDLSQHSVLRYLGLSANDEWRFEGPDGPYSVQVTSAFATDSGTVLRETARAGVGLALLPRFAVADLLASGELIEVLEGSRVKARGLYAITPHRRNAAPKVAAFVTFLARWVVRHGLESARSRPAGRAARASKTSIQGE